MVKSEIRKRNRKVLNDFKDKCFICGEVSKSCLEVHHVGEKKFNVSHDLNNHATEEIVEELKQCIVLCANCHKKVHAGEIVITKDKKEEGDTSSPS